MFKIIYLPTGDVRSTHSTIESVELAMQVCETVPPTHEVVEVSDLPDDLTVETTFEPES
jgi:hypothetical protein